MARPVAHDDHQVVDATLQASRDVFQIIGDRGVEVDRVLARGSDNNFLHVTIGCVQQSAFFRRGQHGNRARSARRAQVGAFERIDGDIDFWNLAAIGKLGADFLPDIEHRGLVALALANHDVAAHGDAIHGLAHGFGGDLVGQRAIALTHGSCGSDGSFFDDTQEFQRQVAFHVFAEAFHLRFGSGIGCHEGLPKI